MKKLFWGFFFILVNFHLSLNGRTLELIPDFVGYLLLLQAGLELRKESRRFQWLRPFAAGMGIYTFILWVGGVLGASGLGNWLDALLGFAAEMVSLYIAWTAVHGILETEQARGVDLRGASALWGWRVLLAAEIAAYTAVLAASPVLMLPVLAATLVGIIWFLAALWTCARFYGQLRPKDAGLGGL